MKLKTKQKTSKLTKQFNQTELLPNTNRTGTLPNRSLTKQNLQSWTEATEFGMTQNTLVKHNTIIKLNRTDQEPPKST